MGVNPIRLINSSLVSLLSSRPRTLLVDHRQVGAPCTIDPKPDPVTTNVDGDLHVVLAFQVHVQWGDLPQKGHVRFAVKMSREGRPLVGVQCLFSTQTENLNILGQPGKGLLERLHLLFRKSFLYKNENRKKRTNFL